jgi:hypothetical protein
MSDFLQQLEQEIAERWSHLLKTNELSALVMSQEFDVRLYALYLLETYHYTLHNSRNQALVAASLAPTASIHYLKFCLKHAYEEAGHELMALHDLKTLGPISLPENLPAPTTAAQTLIDYLYHVSSHGNLKGRLGYSLWAENAYVHIAPMLKVVQSKLKLKPSQMTFLGEHSSIDAEHIEHVRKMIEKEAHDSEDRDAIRSVALKSLDLTGDLLGEIAREYKKLKHSDSDQFKFLNALL